MVSEEVEDNHSHEPALEKTDLESEEVANDEDNKPKLTGQQEIRAIIGLFDETIQYMDFSFERAF